MPLPTELLKVIYQLANMNHTYVIYLHEQIN